MIFRLLILMLVLPVTAHAQFPISPNARTESGLRTGQWTILYDSAFAHEVTDPDSAVYYRLIRFENGIPSGKVRDFYRSGQKQWDGYIISMNPDKMDGECRHYHQNGKISAVTYYNKGTINGPYREYTVKGELKTEGQFENGESTGKWAYYYPGGKKSAEYELIHGKENGNATAWFESGLVSLKGKMVDGNREGVWERYFENGKLQWRANYLRGNFHGFSEEYFDNGQLKEKGECKDGFYDGHWIHYYDNGQKESEGEYIRGRKTGLWKEFSTKGLLNAEMQMDDGKKNGPYIGYYESGKIFCKGFYKDGHYTGEWVFLSEAGLPESKGKYYDTDSLEGIWSYYHANGKLRAAGLYERGFRSGKWSYYFEEGGLKSEETFVRGELQGDVVQFYPDGAILDKINYDHGKQHGTYESYHDNNQLKVKGTYDHAVKNGEWISYYSDGKLNERMSYARDTLNGAFVSDYENGNRFEFGYYNMGQKIGTWKKFYKDGVLRKIEKHEKGKCYWTSYHPNGTKEYDSQGTITNGSIQEHGLKKEYYANGQMRVRGYRINGFSEGEYIFYDSATGKKSERGSFKHDKFDGIWKVYNAKGRVKTRLYYINGFRETVTNVRDSISNLIKVKDFAAATERMEWFKTVLRRDVPPNDIAWTTVYRYEGDIYYGLKQYDKALPVYQQYAAAVKKIESDTTFRYRLALNGQANAYSGLEQYEQALQINEQLLALSADDPYNYPTYTYNKAIVLYKLDRASEGEVELITLVSEYKSKYGERHEYTIEAMHFLAQFQGEFLDKNTQAIKLYKDIYKNADPANSLYLMALRKLSFRYKDIDSMAIANGWLQKAVDYQSEHGLDKYKIYFEDVTQLTEQYFELAQYELAGDVLVKGLNAIEKYGKTESMEFARLLTVACKMVTNFNYDATRSIEYAEKAKTILEKIDGQDSELYETVLSELASAHFSNPLTHLEAEKYYKQLIVVYERKYGKSSPSYYTSVMLLGNYYTGSFMLNKADSILKSVNDVKQRFGTTSNMGAYYDRMMGDLYYFQYRYSDALKYYTAAGDFYLKNEGPYSRLYARALMNQASTMGLWGRKAEAEDLTRGALKIFEKNGEAKTPEYIGQQERLADLLRDQFLYPEAEELYRKVIESTSELYGEDHEKYRSTLLTIGKLQVSMGEYKKAEQNFQRVTTLAFKNPSGANEQNYFKALQELASLRVLQKDIEGAHAYYERAKAAAAFYPDDILYYFLLDRYAKFCATNSRHTQAESLFLQALAFAKRVNGEHHRYYASICSELANVYQQLGKGAEAEKMLTVAISFAEENKDENADAYIETLKSMALNIRRMGRYDESEKLYSRILEYVSVKKPDTNDHAVELIDMGSLQLDWKKYDRAVYFLKPAIRIMKDILPEDHENILIAYNQLGLAYLEQNKIDSAFQLFKFCVDKRNANGRANSFSYMVSVHNLAFSLMRKGKFAEAEKFYQQSFALRKKYNIEVNLQTQATLIDDYGMLYQAWGKHELAEKYWKEALNNSLAYIRNNFSFLSDYEKAKFWERNKADFEYFNTFAIQRSATNRVITADMYNYRLATKGILLSASNKLRKRIYASRDSVMINQYYQWIELREQAAREYAAAKSDQKTPHLDSLERSINSFEKELSISAEDNLSAREQDVTWKAVQQTLGPDEAAVELIRFRYFDRKVSDSTIYAVLVITRETKFNPELIVLSNGDYLEGKAYKYYRNCIQGQIQDDLSYTTFWKPIESAVKNKKRIFISLDGVFNQISLKTLRLPDESFLMDRHDFIIVSNTRDLVAMKSRKKLKLFETASLIGNPKFYLKSAANQTRESDDDRSSIAELPGTKVEIESVQSLLHTQGWKVNALVQQDATEEGVKQLPASRLVHLATHGFFQDDKKSWSTEDPMLRSGLLLTGAANSIQGNHTPQTEDGILTAYEAANLSFEGTELVVLSACETARGEIKQGEGVYGLQRAFITAGAESLVMSLWKVDDKATQKLMSLFYQNLMQGIEKSEALNRAQRELKKEYPHPFYWGAFVMIRG